MDKDQLIHRYNIYIHERVKVLINSGKTFDDFDYNFFSKIYEIFVILEKYGVYYCFYPISIIKSHIRYNHFLHFKYYIYFIILFVINFIKKQLLA